MDLLAFVTLTITGFVSCAEFGSYAFVHPVLRRLPPPERIAVEQGLLKTFGRVMPIGMTLSLVLAIILASRGRARPWSWSAAAAFAASLAFTLVVNVPINRATGRWDAEHPPPGWERSRSRWEFSQGIRSWLLLAGFVLVCAASTVLPTAIAKSKVADFKGAVLWALAIVATCGQSTGSFAAESAAKVRCSAGRVTYRPCSGPGASWSSGKPPGSASSGPGSELGAWGMHHAPFGRNEGSNTNRISYHFAV